MMILFTFKFCKGFFHKVFAQKRIQKFKFDSAPKVEEAKVQEICLQRVSINNSEYKYFAVFFVSIAQLSINFSQVTLENFFVLLV